MPRDRGEGDRRRSLPYDSLRDRPSRHHKHKFHGSDDKQFKIKNRNQNWEKHRCQKKSQWTNVGNYRERSKNEDYGNKRNHKSSRHNNDAGDIENRYRQSLPSLSDDKYPKQATFESNSPSRGKSKRTSGFDVAPPVVAALPDPSGSIGFMSWHASHGCRISGNKEFMLR